MDSEGKTLAKGLSEYVNTLIKRKIQTLENALDIKNIQIKKLRKENELLTQQLKSSATLSQDMSKIRAYVHKWRTQPGDEISDQFTLDEGWSSEGDDTLPDEKQENNDYSGVIEAFQKVCAGCGDDGCPYKDDPPHKERCCYFPLKEQKLSLTEQNSFLRSGCSSSRSIGDPSDEFDNIRKTKF